jgi:hypothetical protein
MTNINLSTPGTRLSFSFYDLAYWPSELAKHNKDLIGLEHNSDQYKNITADKL